MRVILVIYSLTEPGGAERVVSLMANYWAERKGWPVTVATFDRGEKPPFYPLSSEVHYCRLNATSGSSRFVKRVLAAGRRFRVLRRHFKADRPDVIMSFLTGVNMLVLLAGLRTGVPMIVSERNNPAYQPPGHLVRWFRSWLYPKASALVCQTQGVLDLLGPGLRRNGVVIPNPAMPPNNDAGAPEIPLPAGKLLFAVGSMSRQKIHQKGFDLLVPVFANLAERHGDWNLVILGDGPEREAIQRKADECGQSGRVYLPGNVKNVHALLSRGDLFVLSSRYEGFPNGLCEAMACGLPVVSFDCPTGPRDIIRHGVDGLLIPPEDALELEKGLDILMSDQEMREKMGARAREVVDRFSVEKVMGMWEELIVRCVHER